MTRPDFERILDQLPGPDTDLARKDKRFAELGLDEAAVQTRDEIIETLLAHPELMQRPIIVRGDRAIIARPYERVLELLDD